MTDHLKIIDRTPKYNGKPLTYNSQFEFWLQHSIINGVDFQEQLQELVDNNNITNCTIDTFQLIADYVAGKIPKRIGRPEIESTKKMIRIYTLVFAYVKEINVQDRDRMKAIEAVKKMHDGSISEIEKALKYAGIGVRNSRRKN